MNKKIGVLLSGCGVFDGAEIHEATLTLYFLDRQGGNVFCMAPDVDQLHVIDHQNSREADETRNILIESARISRGNMKDLVSISANDMDGLIIPGGFGAAKNLVDYAVKGRDCSIHPDVRRIIREMVGVSPLSHTGMEVLISLSPIWIIRITVSLILQEPPKSLRKIQPSVQMAPGLHTQHTHMVSI